MNTIPVVFTFDKRIILGGAVAIQSLVDCANNDTSYDIYVYHPDIENKYIKEFEKIVENTNHKITFEYISKEKFKNLAINKNGSWTEIVYYRLLIPEILNYDKVIYSDVDVLFKKDLSEIYNTNIEDYEVGAIKAELNTKDTICHKYFEENKNEHIYWSGFLLLNSKKLKKENYFEKFMQTARHYKDRLKFFDLDVLNITCNNIKELPMNYCVLEAIYEFNDYKTSKDYKYLSKIYTEKDFIDARTNPAIIHYAGELGKPWRRKKAPQDYKEYMDKIPKKLKKYTFRDLRKRLFSKI